MSRVLAGQHIHTIYGAEGWDKDYTTLLKVLEYKSHALGVSRELNRFARASSIECKTAHMPCVHARMYVRTYGRIGLTGCDLLVLGNALSSSFFLHARNAVFLISRLHYARDQSSCYRIAGSFRTVQNFVYEYFRYQNKTFKHLAPLDTYDL